MIAPAAALSETDDAVPGARSIFTTKVSPPVAVGTVPPLQFPSAVHELVPAPPVHMVWICAARNIGTTMVVARMAAAARASAVRVFMIPG